MTYSGVITFTEVRVQPIAFYSNFDGSLTIINSGFEEGRGQALTGQQTYTRKGISCPFKAF